MSRSPPLPAVLRRALRTEEARCYRHCERPVRRREWSDPSGGRWVVHACPSGVVSVTVYARWSTQDPVREVRRALERWTRPASRVRARDLRTATRHGPELGRAAERLLDAARPPRPVRVVYWRVYPYTGAGGRQHRLFVCHRPAHPAPVFFTAPATATSRECPRCRSARPARRVRSGRR